MIRVYTVCICSFVRHFGVQNFRTVTILISTQSMFLWRNKKNNGSFWSKNGIYIELCYILELCYIS